MWLNWEKYRDPVVEFVLLPNQKLLETTVPYYSLGLKPPEQTLGRAGIWKKIAQTMEEAELTRPRTMLMLHHKHESDTSTKVKSEEDAAEHSSQAEEGKGAAAEAPAEEDAVTKEAGAAESPTQQRKQWLWRLVVDAVASTAVAVALWLSRKSRPVIL